MIAQAPARDPVSQAAQGNELVGTWKLVSCFMEDTETGERKEPWGKHPNGKLVLTAAGEWIVVQTAQGRKIPQSDEDRCAAFRSLLAYCGRYRVEGRKVVIKVDIVWDESWVGTEQVRYFSVEETDFTLKLRLSVTPILATELCALSWSGSALNRRKFKR